MEISYNNFFVCQTGVFKVNTIVIATLLSKGTKKKFRQNFVNFKLRNVATMKSQKRFFNVFSGVKNRLIHRFV